MQYIKSLAQNLGNIFNTKTAKILGLAFVMAAGITYISVSDATLQQNPQDVQFTWVEDYDSGVSCHVLNPGDTHILRWTAEITNFGPGTTTVVIAAFPDDTAGCAATDERTGPGFTKSGKTVYLEGETGQTTFEFDAGAYDCGRVQIDAGFRDDNGDDIVFMGEVIDYGVDCVEEPEDPEDPLPNPTTITANCVGGNSPQVNLNWHSVANQAANSVQKRVNGGDWMWLLQDPLPFDQFSYTDTNVALNNTYEYRVKTHAFVASNIATVNVTAQNCGFVPPVDQPPTGSLDTANCEIIAGWAKDPDLTSPLQVKIYGDGTSTTGTLVTTITANQSRSDVGNHAFSIPTPSFFTDGNSHTINAYAVDQTNNNALILLAGSPKTIFCPIEPNNPHLTIAKTVRNVTDNHVSFVESVNATAGEQVEFQITVTSNGDATANNVVVTDVLPNNFSFNFASFGSDITQTSNLVFNLGNMPVNTSKTLKITATAASNSSFPIGSSTWTNTANVTSSNANSASDTAQVVINRDQVTTVTIDIDKTARNISDNQTSFSNSVNAEPGDEIEFKIIVSASGNTSAQNVIMTDDLPTNLNLISGSTVSNLGSIAAGDSETTILRVRVADNNNFTCGTTTRTNTADAVATGLNSVSDSANVVITRTTNCGGGGGSANLSIDKQVRNVSDSTSFSNSVSADVNEIVEFRLVIENTGSIDADDVVVTDDLPNGLSYISGSFHADSGLSSGNLFGSGQNLGDLDNGDSRTLTFRARAITTGTHINTATADADNTGSDSDSASVFVSTVQGGNVDLHLSKRAFNQTQNVNATTVTAKAGDVIVYTLRVENRGNATAQDYVFTDDISDIVLLAELMDFNGAGFDLGNLTLTWPEVDIPANGSVEKTFSVRVRGHIPANSDNIMTNIFGNTVNVVVGNVKGTFTAPPTGAGLNVTFALALMSMIGFAGYRNREKLKTLVQNLA